MSDVTELLAEKIAKQQCVLFLGPGVFRETPGAAYSLYELFSMRLAAEIMQDQAFPFDGTQKKNIYYTAPRYLRFKNSGVLRKMNIVDLRNSFIEFSKAKIAGNTLFNDLSSLPLRIIINTNPDNTLFSLIAPAMCPVSSWYDTTNRGSDAKNRYVLSQDDFAGGRTVVYNLFGNYRENPNSLLLTEDELLDYNSRLNHNETMIPKVLTEALDENKYYIFLGFQFDQWLLKIVLKALGLPKGTDQNRITYTVSTTAAPIHEQHFYEDEFRFVFVNQANPELFVADLAAELVRLNQQPATPVAKKKVVFLLHNNNAMDKSAAVTFGNHLTPQIDKGEISTWSEAYLDAADTIETGVKDNLIDADLIVTLISAEMVGERLDRILWLDQIYSQRPVKPAILSVLLRAYDQSSVPFLNKHPWAPLAAGGRLQAVALWPNVDEAFKKVADQIKELLTQ